MGDPTDHSAVAAPRPTWLPVNRSHCRSRCSQRLWSVLRDGVGSLLSVVSSLPQMCRTAHRNGVVMVERMLRSRSDGEVGSARLMGAPVEPEEDSFPRCWSLGGTNSRLICGCCYRFQPWDRVVNLLAWFSRRAGGRMGDCWLTAAHSRSWGDSGSRSGRGPTSPAVASSMSQRSR